MDFKDISPELREKAKACTSPEELLELAKREGYKLSEDELESASGGRAWSGSFGDSRESVDSSLAHVKYPNEGTGVDMPEGWLGVPYWCWLALAVLVVLVAVIVWSRKKKRTDE